MTKAVWRLRRLACVLLISLAATAVEGSTVIYRTDAELAALSTRVVHGIVIRQRAERPDAQTGTIYTVTTFTVLEDFTGVPGREVEVWELGGTLGGETQWIGGAVTYSHGDEVLVFLERGRFGLRSVAMGFGKFDVQPIATADGSLDGRLTRNTYGTSVIGRPAARVPERTLVEMRELTAGVKGVRPVRNRDANLGSESEGSAGFTFLGPARWTEADSGTPVNWYLNTQGPSPLTSSDGVAELQTSLQAWTAPTTASIVLQYAGTTNQSSAKGNPAWTGIPTSGTGVVTFEDPNNEISGSTLAIGGGAWFTTPSSGGTVNGQPFFKFVRGYVIFANAADYGAFFQQSLNFTRVLEHEIGHAIGMGHSAAGDTNIMHPSCCTGATPTPPALGPDDLAGLNFIYPSSTAPACTYSISPSSAMAAAAGGSGNVSVSAGTGCAWSSSVATGATFLTRVSGASGSGNGTVSYTVAANNTTVQRTGTLSIAGNIFTVTQAGGCAYALNASGTDVTATATAGAVNVIATAGCPWTAVSNAPSMVTITEGPSGSGNGIVRFAVSANTSSDARVGTLTIAGLIFTIAQAARLPHVPSDVDGDGRSELVVWRPSTGQWYWLSSSRGYSPSQAVERVFGGLGDTPLIGDMDGDGRGDLVVWRGNTGTFYWARSSNGSTGSQQLGHESVGDIPMLADIDGDGRADLVVWRPSTGTWYWLTSSSGYTGGSQLAFGGAGDTPMLADMDGDGRSDLIVWRGSNGTFYWLNSTNNQVQSKQWGIQSAGDMPLVGDLDGDGKGDLVVWRGPTGQWFWLRSSNGYNSSFPLERTWGSQSTGDVPSLADRDGDGKADITVWRSSTGTWYWLQSTTGFTAGLAMQWGIPTDVPIVK